MKKEGAILSVLLISGIFIFLNLVSAATYCSIVPKADCNSTSTPQGFAVLNLSGNTNAHAEIATYTSSSYGYALCCYGISQTTTPYQCSTTAHPVYGSPIVLNKVIGLSGDTNAQSEATNQVNYNTIVCNSGLQNCTVQATSVPCSNIGKFSVVNLSSTTNAHIGNGPNYNTQICCQGPTKDPRRKCQLKNATWEYSPALNGNNVTLIVNGNSYCDLSTPATVSFTVSSKQGTGSVSGIVAGSDSFTPGKISMNVSWTIPSDSSVIPQGQYVFRAKVAQSTYPPLWSNDSVNSGLIQYLQVNPQTVNCPKIQSAGKAENYNDTSYYYYSPSWNDMSNTCISDPCGISGSLAGNLPVLPSGQKYISGLEWNWTNQAHTSGTCKFWYGITSNTGLPACASGTTLCENTSNTIQPYFCAPTTAGTCPLDQNGGQMIPTTVTDTGGNPTCTDVNGYSSGCVNSACYEYDQDGCDSSSACHKTIAGGFCLSTSVYPEQSGSTETAGSTTMYYDSSQKNVTVELPAQSTIKAGTTTNTLSSSGTLNISLTNGVVIAHLNPGNTLESSGTLISTPDNVIFGIGSSSITTTWPVGTVITLPNGGGSTTSSQNLVKTIYASDTQTYNTCSASNTCVQVVGSGTSTCTLGDNSACVPQTHNVCSGSNTCIQVSGAGTSTCSVNSDCTSTTHNECNSNQQCVQVSGAGTSTCSVNSDCTVTPQTHNTCSASNTCVQVSGAGTSTCSVNSDCTSTTHNECNSNQQCVQVSGAGANNCSISSDCTLQTHNVCSSSHTCIQVSGAGTSTCTLGDNSACIGTIGITITPTTTITKTAGVGTTLCMDSATGALYSYSGSQCPSGSVAAPGGCSSSNPDSSTCDIGLVCSPGAGPAGGYCYDSTTTPGKCTYNSVSTSGNCSKNGFLNYTWTVTWKPGTSGETQPSWCKGGSQVFQCPSQIPLSFFSTYNAIEVVAVIILIYVAIIILKNVLNKKSKKTSKKRKPKKRK